MYITQEADYAMRIVYCLANSATRRDARSISEEVGVTLRFSLKILGKLSNAGIVKSFKGNRGGYELARDPAGLTLREVLSSVQGPYNIARCIVGEDCEPASDSCIFQSRFRRISDMVNHQLDAITFQDLLSEGGNEPCGCGCHQRTG